MVTVHPCDEEDNGGCSDKCDKDGDEAKCSCPELMELIKPDNKICKPGNSSIILLAGRHI